MERIIYTSLIEPDMTEEEKDYQMNYAFDDELVNLKKPIEGNIIAIADMGLWDGRRTGYSIGTRMLSDIMTIGNEDITTLYYDGFNVRKRAVHHDGTNYILFREVRPNVNIDKFTSMLYNNEPVTNSQINYYTKSLKRYVKDVYGF